MSMRWQRVTKPKLLPGFALTCLFYICVSFFLRIFFDAQRKNKIMIFKLLQWDGDVILGNWLFLPNWKKFEAACVKA